MAFNLIIDGERSVERRLATILAADTVGYSKQMGVNEEAAFSALSARRTIIDADIEKHGGRIFSTVVMGVNRIGKAGSA